MNASVLGYINFAKVCFILIFMVSSLSVLAQSTIHLDTNKGLLSNRVNSICLDKNGVLWAGTESGLQVIDKNKNKGKNIFHDGSLNGIILPDLKISCIEQAPDGRLWIGTESGISIIDLESLSLDTLIKPEAYNVNKIVFDAFGGAYFKTQYTLHYVNQQLEISNLELEVISIFDMGIDATNTLWLIASSNSLERVVISLKENKNLRYHKFSKKSFINNESWESNRNWILNKKMEYQLQYSSLFRNHKGKVILKRHHSSDYFMLDIQEEEVIMQMNKDGLKEQVPFFEFGSLDNLLLLDYVFDPNLRQSIFATKNGIYVYRENGFEHCRLEGEYSYRDIFELPDGSILFSSYQDITRMDTSNKVIIKRSAFAPLISMTYLEKDFLISGADADGVYQLNTKSLDLKKTNIKDLVYVSEILKLGRDNLLIAHEGGITFAKYSIYKESVEIELQETYLKNEAVLILYEKGGNEILVGSEKGLYTFKLNSRKKNNLLNHVGFQESVTSIYEDKTHSQYWIGTKNKGVFILDNNFEIIQHISKKVGSFDNQIVAIYSANDSNFWICSYDALTLVNQNGEVIANFPSSSLNNIEEFNRYSHLVLKNSTMYFGGINGAIYFNPEEVEQLKFKDEIFVSRINLINENNKADTTLENINRNLNAVKLDAKNKMFEFELLSNNLTSPLQYQYRLLGFDEEWKESAMPIIRYTNIDPGNYRFEVISKHVSSSNNNTYSIELSKPRLFYKSIWFYILIGLIALGLVSFVIHHIYKSKMRLKELKENVSADLHDDLGYILSKIHRKIETIKDTGLSDSPSVENQLNEISKSSLDGITSLSRIVWVLDDDIDKSLFDLFENMKTVFHEILLPDQEFKSSLKIKKEEQEKVLRSDYCNHLIMIAKETAQNIIKHSDSKRVNFDIAYLSNHLLITIVNSFDEIKFPKKSTNMGLENIRKRVKLMNGNVEVKKESNKFSIRIELNV